MIKLFGKSKELKQEIASSEGEKYFNQGYEYAQFNNHDKAIELFSKSLAVNGENACVYINRGASYAVQERFLLANRDYEAALAIELSNPSFSALENISALKTNMSNIKIFIDFESVYGNEIRLRFKNDGMNNFCKTWGDVLQNNFLNDAALIEHFILEELNELSGMGGIHLEFVINSGFSSEDYKNIKNSDETYEAFKTFKSVLCCFSDDQSLMITIRFHILDYLMRVNALTRHKSISKEKKPLMQGIMRLKEAEVDIIFIAKNDRVIYINDESDHLFSLDKDGDKKLNGSVVNMVFTGQSDGSVIEVFVVFDASDAYTMFTLGAERDERLNYVAQAIFKYFVGNKIEGVFSPTQEYFAQYRYSFKLYQKGTKYFMVNGGQSQAYLVEKDIIKRGSGDEIKPEFWS